jgi:hypothetical protein
MTDESAVLQTTVPVPAETQRALDNERAAVLAAQVGTFKLTPEQQAALLVPATAAIVEVRPTGELYVPGKFYRDVYQQVFGPGAWAVRHGTPLMDMQEDERKSILYLNVFLMAGRCTRCARTMNACLCGGPYEQACIAMAVGAQAYHPRNARLSYDDALEAAITNGLMRCGSKQLGAYSQCWDPRWAEQVRSQIAVRVTVTDWNNKVVQRWRRIDRAPLDGEQGPKPPKPVVVPKPEPQPVVAAAASSPVAERIGQIRRVDPRSAEGRAWWIIVTDTAEHVTDDEHYVRQLETLKAQAKLVVFDDELVPGRDGRTRRKIVEFRIAD